MEWIQGYDPLHRLAQHPGAAALPIVLLLVTLGLFEWRAHRGADRTPRRDRGVGRHITACPRRPRSARHSYGAAYGLLPIGWIVRQCGLPLQPDRDRRPVRHREIVGGAALRRSPRAGDARRLFVRRLHRGRGRLRDAGGDYGRLAERARLHAPLLGRPVAHRQHRAGRLRRDRHPDPHPGDDHRHSCRDAQRHGRAAAAVRVSGRPRLAGRDDERMARAAWRVAGGAGGGGSFAIVQFLWSNYVGPELVDIAGGLASLGSLALLCVWWKPRETWDFPAAGAGGGTAAVAGARASARRRWQSRPGQSSRHGCRGSCSRCS